MQIAGMIFQTRFST
ncbi:hypothetical protein [Blautia sp.]